MNIFGSLFSYFKSKGNRYNIYSDDRSKDDGGIKGDEIDALSLDIKDEELIEISKTYQRIWSQHWGQGLKEIQDLNKEYWSGNHMRADDEDPFNNVIFESLETYLPLVTKQYPQPIVTITGDEAGEELAKVIQKYLYYLSDELNLRNKISACERYRKLSLFGVIKMGWDITEDEISCKPINPQNMILDPDAIVEDGYYKGEYLGEYKEATAERIIALFPECKDYFEKEVGGKLGTKLTYVEWWGQKMVWWQYKDKILDKRRNPHFNYGDEEDGGDINEEGLQYEKQNNYFNEPRIPYIIHTVYNMEHPYDETSDVTQCIPLQDIVNKRLRQIDFNADNANGGLVISGEYFDAEQGDEVADALRNGGVVWQKRGKPNEGVYRDTGRPLTSEIFNHLSYSEQAIRNIIGVSGSSSQALANEETVRGKIISSDKDGSRSATAAMNLEILYKNIFKWFMQLIYVYYTMDKKVSIIGEDKVQQEIAISNVKLRNVKVKVSVKDGSMIPKDPLTKRNEAIDLWTSGAIDPITLFNRLDFDNPRELAVRMIQYQSDPIGYLQSDNIDTTVQRMKIEKLIEMKSGSSMKKPQGKQAIPASEKAGTNQKKTSQGNIKKNTGVNYESEDGMLGSISGQEQ